MEGFLVEPLSVFYIVDKLEFIQFVLRLFLPMPLELRQIHDLDIAQFHRLSGPYPFFTNYSPILHVFQHERNNP